MLIARGLMVSGLKQVGGGTDGHEHRYQIIVCYNQALALGRLSPGARAVQSPTSAQLLLALPLSSLLPLIPNTLNACSDSPISSELEGERPIACGLCARFPRHRFRTGEREREGFAL